MHTTYIYIYSNERRELPFYSTSVLCADKTVKMNSSGVTGAAASILHKTVATSFVSIALLLNIVCIILTAKITCGKPQWPNVLVLHMGIIDVCMVVLVMIPSAITLYIPTVLNQLYFCQYQGTVLNMWYIIELVLLCQIMFDRYFAITHPFVYSKRILKSKALVWSNAVFAGTTTVAILIACLPLTTRVEFVIVGPGLCFWDISQDKALPTSIVYVVITWTILAVLVFLTGSISIGVHRMLRRAHSSDTDHVRKNMNKMEINFAKLAIVTSLVYGASSIPFTVSEH